MRQYRTWQRVVAVVTMLTFCGVIGVGLARGDSATKNENGGTSAQFDVKNHITGKLSDLRKSSVKGMDRFVGVLTTNDGASVMVNLGNPDQTQKLTLKNGNKVSVIGPLARYSGQEIIVADKVQKKRKSAAIDRKFFEISGRVSDLQFAAAQLIEPAQGGMETIATSHLLAAVKSNDGKTVWIDFGPGQKLAELKVQPGDQVSARGVFVGFKNGEVLVAHDIQKGDQKVVIDWSRELQVIRQARRASGSLHQ